MMKATDKAKQTTNKDNGMKDTTRITMCEYMSCHRTQGKPPSQRPIMKIQLLGSGLPTNDEHRTKVHDRTKVSCDSETN
jgi:hypothetical protein